MPPLRRVSGFKVLSKTAPKMVGLILLQSNEAPALLTMKSRASALI